MERGTKPAFFSPLRFLPLDIREDLEYNIEVGCNPFVAEYLATDAERPACRSALFKCNFPTVSIQ